MTITPKRRWPRFTLRTLFVVLVVFGFSIAVAEDKDKVIEVKASDIHSGRAKIIGYLGHPLGEVVTVRGNWCAPPLLAKDPSPIFRVTHIDGKPVKQQIDLTSYRIRPVHPVGRSGRQDKDGWDWKAQRGGTLAPPGFKAFKAGEAWEFSGMEACSVHAWDTSDSSVAAPPDFGANGFLFTFEFIQARQLTAQPRK